ncbi:MAG: purH, partial [Acidimicrobiaceae bacterium]
MPTALLSVYDKTGIVHLAAGLHDIGFTIISSGGTARTLLAEGIPATDLADVTGVPAILDHRVVTLHPKVHGGLLADPTSPAHQADMAEYGIAAIDLVVVNLYPFESDPSIELIDIGGPAMVRAAAKNHAHVAVVVNPGDYGPVLDELRTSGAVSENTRRRLARDAFATIAAYDAQIATWFDAGAEGDSLPDGLHLSLTKKQPLRYGENPHQQGARYLADGRRSWWDDAVQHGGKELSYLNLYDTEAAWRLVHRFQAPACVIVKHANPCGVAVSG